MVQVITNTALVIEVLIHSLVEKKQVKSSKIKRLGLYSYTQMWGFCIWKVKNTRRSTKMWNIRREIWDNFGEMFSRHTIGHPTLYKHTFLIEFVFFNNYHCLPCEMIISVFYRISDTVLHFVCLNNTDVEILSDIIIYWDKPRSCYMAITFHILRVSHAFD